MEDRVMIVSLDRGFQQWVWLCQKHLAAWKRKGWEVKDKKPAPHPIPCDDCKRAER